VAQFGSIINDPCPIGLIILRIKSTKKKNDQFMEAIISRRTFICPRALNGGSNGAIEVLTAERLRFRRQAQRKGYEDRN
jgi:hypothetical protein